MLFRKRLFTVLALISLLYLVYGFTGLGKVTQESLEDTAALNNSTERGAAQLGVGIGVTGVTLFLICTGLPMFFLFSLLAWRNGVGLRTEQRHQEQLAALQGKT